MSRTHRHRHDEAQFDLDQIPDCGSTGSDALLLRTDTLSSYPTIAGVQYACVPVIDVNVDEREGAAVSFNADPSTTILAVNLGTAVPPIYTYVIASNVGGKWCFRYDG